MTEAIIALVVVLLAGCGYLAFRYRSDRGIESGISSFRRELRALAPRDGTGNQTADPRPRILRDPVAPDREPPPDDAAPEPDTASEPDAAAVPDGDEGAAGDDPAGAGS